MLKEEQVFTVKWYGVNIKHYESLGYKFTKLGDSFEVPLEHLPKRSKTKVLAICDFCGKEYVVSLDNYNNKNRESEKIACKDCKNKNSSKTMMDKYGVLYPLEDEGIKNKQKITVLEKYGVENVMQSKEVQEIYKESILNKYGEEHISSVDSVIEKRKETNIKKYGTESCFANKDIQEKIKKTNLKKYGFENAACNLDVIEKMKQTNIIRYGGESSQCSPEVRKKSFDSLISHGGIPSSKTEIKTIEILEELYGKDNCIRQYFFDHIIFDCLLSVNGINIDVEYDGRYWHDKERDKRRDYFTTKNGFKVFRIISDTNVPTKEQIIDGINYLVNNDHNRYIIEI